MAGGGAVVVRPRVHARACMPVRWVVFLPDVVRHQHRRARVSQGWVIRLLRGCFEPAAPLLDLYPARGKSLL